jgi:hypothetical protein
MPNPAKPYRIECDSSDYGLGAVLLQPDELDPSVVNMTCSVSVTNQVNVRQCLYSACALTAL